MSEINDIDIDGLVCLMVHPSHSNWVRMGLRIIPTTKKSNIVLTDFSQNNQCHSVWISNNCVMATAVCEQILTFKGRDFSDPSAPNQDTWVHYYTSKCPITGLEYEEIKCSLDDYADHLESAVKRSGYFFEKIKFI